MTFRSSFKRSLFGFWIAAVTSLNLSACPDTQGGCTDRTDAKAPQASTVEEAFLSACHTAPDPASMSYYLDLLESGARTSDEVKASITTSCTSSKSANLCQHVSGLDDLCNKTTNN